MRKLTFLFAVIFMIVAGVNVKAEESDVKYDDVVVADGVAYGIVKASKTAGLLSWLATDENGNHYVEMYMGDFVVPQSITVDGESYTVTELEDQAFLMSGITKTSRSLTAYSMMLT